MNAAEVTRVLEEKGAVLRGHFRLSSGRHSDVFVQKFRIFEHPRLTQRFGEEIARLFPDGFDVVASPAVGAIALGFAAGLAADRRFVFAERAGERLELRRGFELHPHERVLIVEDVVTTGGSAREVVDVVRTAGANPVGVGVLLDRSDHSSPPDLGAPFKSLVRLAADTWAEDECPLCRSGAPLDDPGSRRLQ